MINGAYQLDLNVVMSIDLPSGTIFSKIKHDKYCSTFELEKEGIHSRSTITRSIKKLLNAKLIEFISEEKIVELLKTKNLSNTGLGNNKCLWCKCNTLITNLHHYPISKANKGTELVEICPTCHYEFHSLQNAFIVKKSYEEVR